MVGMVGFEPAISCSQSKRASQLRYIPTADFVNYSIFLPFGNKNSKKHQYQIYQHHGIVIMETDYEIRIISRNNKIVQLIITLPAYRANHDKPALLRGTYLLDGIVQDRIPEIRFR